LLLLLLPIITSCVTTQKSEIVLPVKPQRQEIKDPETIKDYAKIIVYYDSLVQEWELWAKTVENQVNQQKKPIENKLPE